MSWSSQILQSVLNSPISSNQHAKRAMLKVQAARSAQARNHRLAGWTDYAGEKASAVCEVCGKEAYVDANPAPNGIDVSGEAVALNCSRDCIRRIKISYEVVTPESAEIGDFAETGWEDEEGVCIDPDDSDVEEVGSEFDAIVMLAVNAIGNGVEASDNLTCCPGHTWYTEIDGETDYEDGSNKRLSYHLDGFSEEEEEAIYTALCGK